MRLTAKAFKPSNHAVNPEPSSNQDNREN